MKICAVTSWVVLIHLLMLPKAAAGTWGTENWGQMYWGDNPVTSPVVAPQVESVSVYGDTLTFQISEYSPGQDGWSAIQSYTVTCGEGISETTTTQTLEVTGLDEETLYTCQIFATNAAGQSIPLVQQVATEALQQSLPVWLLYEASKRS